MQQFMHFDPVTRFSLHWHLEAPKCEDTEGKQEEWTVSDILKKAYTDTAICRMYN